MEADEIKLLLELRKGIVDRSWEEVVEAWNDLSGESLEVEVDPKDKLRKQIQAELRSTSEHFTEQPSGKIDPFTNEEELKDDDIVPIEKADGPPQPKKNRRPDARPKPKPREFKEFNYSDDLPSHIKEKHRGE